MRSNITLKMNSLTISSLQIFASFPLFAARLLLASILILSQNAFSFDLPKFDKDDLSTGASVLGYGTSSRFLSNPFPLGGYTGFEIGYTYETLDIEDLYFLSSNTTADEDRLSFSRLSFGKGLFGDVDIFINFSPFSRNPSINEYGSIVKWNFYQADYVPISFSLLAHFNTINIQDDFTNESNGLDLLAGVNVDNFAVYFGGGLISTRSVFSKNILNACTAVGVPTGCDDSFGLNPDKARIRDKNSHSLIGAQMSFLNFFVAAQIDRYTESVFSLKLGYRE